MQSLLWEIFCIRSGFHNLVKPGFQVLIGFVRQLIVERQVVQSSHYPKCHSTFTLCKADLLPHWSWLAAILELIRFSSFGSLMLCLCIFIFLDKTVKITCFLFVDCFISWFQYEGDRCQSGHVLCWACGDLSKF